MTTDELSVLRACIVKLSGYEQGPEPWLSPEGQAALTFLEEELRIHEMRRVEGKRILDERNSLFAAIERYADTLILDQPLDETSPLRRAIVAHDLRSFLDFAANGGLLTTEESSR